MVVWEIALGTAYFLGLKRSYKLALKIQRRLVTPNSPNIRQFLQRRTRAVFDVTLKVHREIQKRDLEVGRNLGNWTLKWLDRMKPAAQIRAGGTVQYTSNAMKMPNMQLTQSRLQKTIGRFRHHQESGRRLVTSSRNLWLNTYPTVSNLLRRQNPIMSNMQFRQLASNTNTSQLGFRGGNGVIRNDIKQWLNYA